MKNALRAVLLLVVIALGIWAWTIFFPNPRQVVRNRLNKLAHLASSPAKEGNIGRGLDVQRMGAFFSEDVHVMLNISDRGVIALDNREELLRGLLVIKAPGAAASAEFQDMRIEMGTANLTALVDLTLKAKVDGQGDPIFQELKFALKKIKGDWLITNVE